MTSFTDLSQQIAQLYPLHDKQAGKRYRIVGELAGTTELEEMGGQARYVDTQQLQDAGRWERLS